MANGKQGRLNRHNENGAKKHRKGAYEPGEDCAKTAGCTLFAKHEGPCVTKK